MAAHIDDGGIRQHGVDQAHVAEVVRHLVDEARSPAAQRRRLLDVAAAEPRELRRRARADAFRVCIVLADSL